MNDYRVKKKFMLLLISYIVIYVISGIRYNFSVIDTVIMIFNIVIFCNYFRQRNFKDNFSYLMLWGYILLSCMIVATFQIYSDGFSLESVSYQDFEALAVFSNRLMFVISIPLLFFSNTFPQEELKGVEQNIYYSGNNILVLTRVFLLVAYLFTAASYLMGITDVAESTVILPFHLNGFIDEYRRNIFPILFAIYVYDCYSRNRRFNKIIIILYFIWSIIEMFIRVSKGAVLTSFLPAFVVLFITGKINKKTIITQVLPVVAIFLIFYPVIEKLRHVKSISFASVVEAFKIVNENGGNSSPYLRVFISGIDYIKVRGVVGGNSFFDFRRAFTLAKLGGTAPFITHVIDNFSSSAHHSSGTTGIVDPLLWGGYGFCYIIVFILAIFTLIVDNKKVFRKKRLYQLVMIFFLKTLIMQRSISYFFDSLFFASSISLIIQLVCVKLYYKYLVR